MPRIMTEPQPASANSELASRKAALRRLVRDRLRAMTAEDRVAGSARICERLQARPRLAAARRLMAYMPLPSEVDVEPVALWCLARGVELCMPWIDADRREIVCVAVPSLSDEVFAIEALGIRAPRGGKVLPPSQLDAVVVPGLAFDAQGRRLGRGGGYYDRLLGQMGPDAEVVAVAFACQLVDEVPAGPLDRTVPAVVTDADAFYTQTPPLPSVRTPVEPPEKRGP